MAEVKDNEAEALMGKDTNLYTKEAIASRLVLVHGLFPGKWKQAQEVGAVLCPRELVARGLIKEDEITNKAVTLTNEDDIALGKDNYVFLSVGQSDYGFGGFHLEVDPAILDQPGVVVNTAGDSLNFQNPQSLRDYYLKSVIPGREFLDYMVEFLKKLPNPEWFFGKRDAAFKRLQKKSIIEANPKHYSDHKNYKLFHALFPEIMVPTELPLSMIINLVKDEHFWDPNEGKSSV